MLPGSSVTRHPEAAIQGWTLQQTTKVSEESKFKAVWQSDPLRNVCIQVERVKATVDKRVKDGEKDR